jgi:hypothetical protein
MLVAGKGPSSEWYSPRQASYSAAQGTALCAAPYKSSSGVRHMKTSKRLLLLTLLAGPLLGIILGFTYRLVFRYHPPKPFLISASREFVIGPHPEYQGDPKSPFVLVEFVDYHCSACIDTRAWLKRLLERNPGKLKMAVRYFPFQGRLVSDQATILAECAGEQGCFWPVHEALLACKGRLDSRNLMRIARTVSLRNYPPPSHVAEMTRARIQKDVNTAKSLHINYTPALFLCRPDKKVMIVISQEQIEDYMREYPMPE